MLGKHCSQPHLLGFPNAHKYIKGSDKSCIRKSIWYFVRRFPLSEEVLISDKGVSSVCEMLKKTIGELENMQGFIYTGFHIKYLSPRPPMPLPHGIPQAHPLGMTPSASACP